MVVSMEKTDKLKFLLEQINLDSEYQNYFVGGTLDKIVGSKDKCCYKFEVSINDTLPLSVYLSFLHCLSAKYSDYKVSVICKTNNKNTDYINEYFSYLIKDNLKEYPLLEAFLDTDTSFDDNTFTIEVANKAEQMKFKSIEDKWKKLLTSIGFEDVKMEVKINEQKEQAIIDEIEKSKQVDVEAPKKEIIQILGQPINKITHEISNVIIEEDNVSIEAYVFAVEEFESAKSSFKILTLKITDFKDSMYAKLFVKDDNDWEFYKKHIKEGNWYKFRGYTKYDKYANEVVLNLRDVAKSDKVIEKRKDLAEEKRVELHAHTMMSQMDGVVDAKKLVKQAIDWGHKAIAITDHNGAQAFPDVYHLVCDVNKGKEEKDKFKAIYGAEFTLIDDTVNIVVREDDSKLLDNTYVVFDFETTGFNAGGGDSIIEIGAVKIHNGEIIDKYDELINPGHKLSPKIVEVTNITDEMLQDKDNEENAIKRFIEWYGDLPMVAHNAKFDTSFLEMCYKKYNLGEYKNPVIDTLELSRVLDSNYARHNLTALVKRYDVPWDENAHHRGDYDALGTALVLHKMLLKLSSQNIEYMSQLNKMVDKNEIHKYGRSYHVNILVKNKTGLKNLFKIISLANTKYLYKTPRILRSEIEAHREGLLIGSGCYESEVFQNAKSKSDDRLGARFYSDFFHEDGISISKTARSLVKRMVRLRRDSGSRRWFGAYGK